MRVHKLFAALLGAVLVTSCSMFLPPRKFAATYRTDPYLWLEEVEGARALDWVRAENARSLAVLENDPRYQPIEAEALAIAQSRDRLPTGQVRGDYYYNFWQDDEHVRGLWRRSSLEAFRRGTPIWETLLDVDALAARENANWVFQGAECSPSGLRCMLELSDGGKDAASWREFDVTSRTFVQNGFVVPEAKASVEWRDEDTLVVGTDWGEGSLTQSGYPFILKEWRRGAPLASARELVRGQATDVGMFVTSFDDIDGTRLMVANESDTFFETTFWILGAGAPQRVSLPAKSTIRAFHKGQIVATLEEAWRFDDGRVLPTGALIAFPLAEASAPAPRATILHAPGARESIDQVAATRDAILAAGYVNVRGQMLRFAFDGSAWSESQIGLPPNGVINLAGADSSRSTAFAVFDSFLVPSTLFAIDAQSSRADAIKAVPPQFNADGMIAEQYEARSRDGTEIPYFVVRRRDAPMNKANPTLLYAYGGFQLSQLPTYNPYVGKLWLERGGVYVLANIRGGGEFGPAWHDAGLKTHRQVIYDDFIAVAEDLIRRDFTSPRRLGISGRSNGGLLMGVLLNQRPDLFRAAVVGSPLLDMLRYDQLLAGASWVDEYGSPSVPEERRWLQEMSPYQNLQQRSDFPTPFIYTSTKDDRVHPGHARKYAARLEELEMPFLYYENIEGGHSAAANQREIAHRRALEFTYLSQRLID